MASEKHARLVIACHQSSCRKEGESFCYLLQDAGLVLGVERRAQCGGGVLDMRGLSSAL